MYFSQQPPQLVSLINKKLSAIYFFLASFSTTMTIRTSTKPSKITNLCASKYSSSSASSSTLDIHNINNNNNNNNNSNNINNFNFINSISSSQQQQQQTFTIFLLPDELLTEICELLSPEDLYSLSSTCKIFRSFLWSSSSLITQQIWRNSRRTYYPQYKALPLKDMSEQQYIFLTTLAKKCQFCEEMEKKKLKKYWEFQVYSCEKCIRKRIASHKTLLKNDMIHEDVLSTCLNLGEQGYFLSHVKMAQIDYLQCQDKFSWVTHKQLDVIQQKCRIISILLDEFYEDSILSLSCT
ncbi:hypothetical protein Glove_306g60 [Diversispora epigaea]|uniref:F-box domain-containing protein n=1 Tax=Diversispora epigaea TaxID=1348612 RepID=A0A397HTW8_9GLOM|nr:hypothetical protein Glove_306g60 [Diversispora epigaea]